VFYDLISWAADTANSNLVRTFAAIVGIPGALWGSYLFWRWMNGEGIDRTVNEIHNRSMILYEQNLLLQTSMQNLVARLETTKISDANVTGTKNRGPESQSPARTAIARGRGSEQAVAIISSSDLIKEVTTQTFKKDVIEESKRQPVLVDFWAPWCGPCKQLTPILEKLVKGDKGKVKLVKMNIDDHPQIPGQMGIQSIPAVMVFADEWPVDGFMGALPEPKIVEFLERIGRGDFMSPQSN
jgi:thioredoxin